MSNVVALRPRAPIPAATSEAFEQAWRAYPETGRLRSSRKESLPEWRKACRETGEEALLSAVLRYAKEDKEHKKDCGAPGFHRWLKWGRYEHWLSSTSAPVNGRRFPDDAIRNAVIAATSEAFVISYLDPCEVSGTVLLVRTSIGVSKLRERATLFKGLGFTAMRKLTAADTEKS